MKIVFVAQPIDLVTPPVRAGSVALWICYIARRLVALGHRATVIGNNGGRLHTKVLEQEAVKYILTPTLIDAQVNRIGRRLAPLTSRGKAKSRLYVCASWHHLPFGIRASRAAAAEQADVIHVMNFSQFIPRIRRRNPRAVIALHMHCEWLTQFPREIIAPRLQLVDLIIGCSQYITELTASAFPEFANRCVTVPNAANVVPQERIAAPSSRRAVFVGRLSPEKGVHDLIVAFRSVLEKFPDASLHLIGSPGSIPLEYLVGLSDDPHVQALRMFYERPHRLDSSKDLYLGALEDLAGPELGRRIFFEGYVDHHVIQDHYRQASVLVNPSLSESFGIPLVEAMMMKIPVVATRVGGMQHTVVQNQTGLLVAPADPAALANAIGLVLADPELASRLGAAGRTRALERFSWDVAADQLVEAYSSVTKRR